MKKLLLIYRKNSPLLFFFFSNKHTYLGTRIDPHSSRLSRMVRSQILHKDSLIIILKIAPDLLLFIQGDPIKDGRGVRCRGGGCGDGGNGGAGSSQAPR